MIHRIVISAFALCAPVLFAETAKFQYDEAGRLTRIEYGSGTVITYSYDKVGNLLRRTVEAPPEPAAIEKAETGKPSKKKASRKSR